MTTAEGIEILSAQLRKSPPPQLKRLGRIGSLFARLIAFRSTEAMIEFHHRSRDMNRKRAILLIFGPRIV